LEEAVQIAFDENRRVYGQRKLKHVLLRKGRIVSRRKIGRIMKLRGLVSAYTRKKYRVHASRVNAAPVPNLIDRQFSNRLPGACVVSDLTYVRVGIQWVYICMLLDLGAREIVGYSAGAHKNAELVHEAFASVRGNLFEIEIFHTDRGSEFDNMLMDELLESFQIRRSLSMKGCPYDNAVAESTFKLIKAEFIASRRFDTLEQLRLELADFIHWFNHIRLHGTLGYQSPVEFRNACTL
jgi:transposase InsO family protein